MNELKKDKGLIFLIVLFVIMLTVGEFCYIAGVRNSPASVGELKDTVSVNLGEQLVYTLYEFDSISALNEERDALLESIVTPDVYEELTFDNEGRMLRTYLKLKKGSVKVHVLKSTPDLVLYNLETNSISRNRLFALVYEVNDNNKISYVREMECIDFVATSN